MYHLNSIISAGHFSDFIIQKNSNKCKNYLYITWEAKSVNYIQFQTEKPYFRQFGFLPLEVVMIKIHQDTQIFQEPDMWRWI